MGEHTALPWNVRDHTIPTGGRHIWVEGGPSIGETRAGPYKRQILEDDDYSEKAGDAAFIVKACNAHADLVKKLDEIQQLSKPGQTINITQAIDILTDIWNASREALAKAGSGV